MTTIAYKDGVLAADSLITNDGYVAGFTTKAVRVGSILAGSVATLALSQRFLDWVRGGLRGAAPDMRVGDDSAVGVVIDPSGRILEWNGEGPPDVVTSPYAAWGSGRFAALGAMASGASADEAVRAAIEVDVYSGGPITVLRRDE